METKLLPCPHCGGEAELDECCGRYVVFCKNSKCSWRDTEAEAIEAWNTRHERTVNLMEAVDAICGEMCGDGWDWHNRAEAVVKTVAEMCGAKVVE